MCKKFVFFCIIAPSLLSGAGKPNKLFDGNTLAGWTSKDGAAPGEGWKVEDGCIVRTAKAGDLYTKASFENFDFSFEWKIVAGCNSGVKYRVADYSGSLLGPEYQVLDDAKWKYESDHKGAAGGLYAIKGPRADKLLKPVGEFNTSRIVARGSRLEHWLNGEVVVEMEIGSAEWEALHAASKFKKRSDFGTKKGRIMLQDHGGKVWFRNLKIREL